MPDKKTLAEVIRAAAAEPDRFLRRERIQAVVAFMRVHLGWTARKCRNVALTSGLTADDWEELLEEIDYQSE